MKLPKNIQPQQVVVFFFLGGGGGGGGGGYALQVQLKLLLHFLPTEVFIHIIVLF